MAEIERIETCRGCGTQNIKPVFDLGRQPLADGLMPTRQAAINAPRYPLRLALCSQCGLVQLLETPPPQMLFGTGFPYYSSVIAALVEHARLLADDIMRQKSLGGDSLVLELASNDGYLLQHFHNRGIPVMGIDPASGPVAAARARGIETIEGYFDEAMAEALHARGIKADVIVANNVLAHVPDPVGFLRGAALLLAENGILVLEMGWARALLEQRSFDTVYHEHHCYFTAKALLQLFARAGLTIHTMEPIDVQGGSLRVRAGHDGITDTTTHALVEAETRAGVFDASCWQQASEELIDRNERLHALLQESKATAMRCAAYGAAAKGAMLLNLAGLGTDHLLWVADTSPHKQGRFMPGSGLEIVSPEHIQHDRPEHLLLLAWNWREEIANQQQVWLEGGGRFVLPVPEPQLWPQVN